MEDRLGVIIHSRFAYNLGAVAGRRINQYGTKLYPCLLASEAGDCALCSVK